MAKHSPRRALITGASSGIGAALAKRLAKRDVEVWIAARRVEKLAAVRKEIADAGGTAHVLPLDVSDHDRTRDAVAALDEEVGGIDLVVANAGIGGASGPLPLATSTWEEIAPQIQINLLGALATITPLIPKMVQRGRGQVCGVSSIAADVPLPVGASYGASKAGLTLFLESADLELRPLGIPVTIVHPGFVKTEMTDGADFQQPFQVEVEDAARAIDQGLIRGDRLVRFPRPLSAAAWTMRRLPTRVRDAIILAAVPGKLNDKP